MVNLNSLGSIKSYIVLEAKTPLFGTQEFEVPQLSANDCFVKIECCSVGQADLLLSEGQVPGHEIVGSVVAVGSDVEGIKPGMRVGMGFFSHKYYSNFDQLVPNEESDNTNQGKLLFPNVAYGGFADGVVWDARYVYPIPKNMSSAIAAPIMFSGSLAYSALCDVQAKSGDCIGILGIGGLGHLAIQFAKAWGCRVIAMSSKMEKAQDCFDAGADEFYDINDEIALQKAPKMDCILNTLPIVLKDYDLFVSLLQPGGTLGIIGIPDKSIIINTSYLVSGCKRITGIAVSSPITIMDALEFAANKNIKPKIEVMKLDETDCTIALQKVKNGTVRYKVVLCAPEYTPVTINHSW